jgi:hypothetical protein
MKKLCFVLAALAAVAFALPSVASAEGMYHHHHHHHYHHHWR